MQQHHKNTKKEIRRSTFSTIERMHPYKILLYLSIIGSSMIFLFMIAAFKISQPNINNFEYFRFPRAFVVSTIILLMSSFTISKVLFFYKSDNLKSLSNSLGITLFLGLFFVFVQYLGWMELSSQGIIFSDMPSDSYLYVVSGLHIFHCIVGLGFLGYMYYSILKIPKDPIYSLLLFTNPFEKMKLELLVIYWHFIDILWMAIFFYFLFTF